MLLSKTPFVVLALLVVSFFGNFLLGSFDGRCEIEPIDGHVDWPSKKKKIGRKAFKKCKKLRSICIPSEVESIHNTAFHKSGLDLTKLYKVPCNAGPPPLFNLKGPLQIERSVEGEPAAVLAAIPTDYTLEFTIELKSIPDNWGSIITLTAGGWVYPDYLYGTMVPRVFVSPGSTEIVVFCQDDENGYGYGFFQSLELNKKSTVLIKVYETTATISVNGVIEDTQTVGTHSQLNNVELYIGDPWYEPANAIVSDISFGPV